MPKFFFHFAAAGVSAEDRAGKELASLAEAHVHAVWLVEQATRYFEPAHDWTHWTVRICDPGGRLLLTVLFRACMTGASKRQRRIA